MVKTTAAELVTQLQSSTNGLSNIEVNKRLQTYGLNQFQSVKITWLKIYCVNFRAH